MLLSPGTSMRLPVSLALVGTGRGRALALAVPAGATRTHSASAGISAKLPQRQPGPALPRRSWSLS
jgi:hypothetical protein